MPTLALWLIFAVLLVIAERVATLVLVVRAATEQISYQVNRD